MARNTTGVESTKVVNVKISADLHTKMKIACVQEGITIADFVEEAIAEKLGILRGDDSK